MIEVKMKTLESFVYRIFQYNPHNKLGCLLVMEDHIQGYFGHGMSGETFNFSYVIHSGERVNDQIRPWEWACFSFCEQRNTWYYVGALPDDVINTFYDWVKIVD